MENTTAFTQPVAAETDSEVRSLHAMCLNESEVQHPWWHNFKFSVVGIFFGIVFVKAEIISWFRIQEMFRLESFHMYGVIGTAVVVGVISVFLIKKLNARTIYGERITFTDKTFNKGQIIGGLIFGLGWAITGACPGPLFAQIGTGALVITVTLLSAIAGTWAYGYLRDQLPH
ncbi:MAG: YeeE/YedE family protein [Saprospiraceae bacterium]|nr:YeeE/YedE family protein [Saprospiraceae bacterium]